MAFSTNSGDSVECKQAENALSRESGGMFRRLADFAPALIWMSDTSKHCIWFNDTWLSYTGRSMEQELGDGWREGVHPGDLQRYLDVYTSAFDARERFQLEYRLRRHDGCYGWICDVGIPRLADDHSFEGYIGYCWDITDRIRTSDALQVSERRFRAIFNSTFSFIGLLSPDGVVLEANQTALDFAGLKEEDVVGQLFWETKWWAYSPEVQDHLKSSIQEAARGKLVRYEVEHIGANGRIAFVDFSLKPVLNEQGETVLIIPEGRDITERKRAEEQEKCHKRELAHVMRLSTMGEMASGLAHELNQPLTALTSYCGTAAMLVKDLPSPPQQLVEILGRAEEQAHRAGQIIRYLRDFLSKADDRMEPVDIDQVIVGVIDFIKPELKNGHVKIEHQPGARGYKVMANKIQVEQVLVNLVLNSLESIKGSGKTTGNIIVQTRQLPYEMIETTVADDGPGIDADMAGRMFDPFQTNKSSGMGMGLSISRSIVEEYGGKLWADVQRGNGALFGFNLPVCE